MAETQTLPDYPRGLTFEQVWAALKETDRLQKENALRQKETDRQIKEINKRFGDFSNRFGEIAEYMVAPGLQDKFRKMGHTFQKASNHAKFHDYDKSIFFEVDIMLENGDKAILVEVKTKPSTEDVQDHIERLEKMRKYANLHGDKRSFLGAVASVVMTKNVKDYALKQGFYVIEPTGETFNITTPDGQPKEW